MVEVKFYDSVDDSLLKRNLNYDETNEKSSTTWRTIN